MIGLLRGVVVRAAPEQVLLDVSGVGYAVRIALPTFYELDAREKGASVELLIRTIVREDAIELFGFLTQEEKTLFEKLISVSGIGPRLAQSVLSGMPPRELLAALAAGDVPRLVRIPGVGKKTAERMVLELQETARTLARELPEDVGVESPVERDVVAALSNLGYRPAEAEKAVAATLASDGGNVAFADLLKASLKRLSRL